MKTMAKYPGLMRRGTRWYLRVKVPADLVEEFMGEPQQAAVTEKTRRGRLAD